MPQISIVYLRFSILKISSVIVFSLQAAVTHGHDIAARDFFSRQQSRQEHVKGRKWIMEHATG